MAVVMAMVMLEIVANSASGTPLEAETSSILYLISRFPYFRNRGNCQSISPSLRWMIREKHRQSIYRQPAHCDA